MTTSDSASKATLIDLFRQYHTDAISRGYTASERVTFFTLLGMWNEARRPEKLRTTRAVLTELTGLSRTSLDCSLKKLADRGYINTTTKYGSVWIRFKTNESSPKVTENAVIRARDEKPSEIKETPAPAPEPRPLATKDGIAEAIRRLSQ